MTKFPLVNSMKKMKEENVSKCETKKRRREDSDTDDEGEEYTNDDAGKKIPKELEFKTKKAKLTFAAPKEKNLLKKLIKIAIQLKLRIAFLSIPSDNDTDGIIKMYQSEPRVWEKYETLKNRYKEISITGKKKLWAKFFTKGTPYKIPNDSEEMKEHDFLEIDESSI